MVVQIARKKSSHSDIYTEFLRDLPRQAELRCLSGLQLPAWKFPQPGKLLVWAAPSDQHILAADGNGGDDDERRHVLTLAIFDHERPPANRAQSITELFLRPNMFEIGQIYNRKQQIHDVYGGQRQGGISTPAAAPFVFLFTGDTGEQYGYKDGWDASGVFLYTGEGQVRDMEFIRGNAAIRDHAANGKDLLVFRSLGKGRGYRYLGTFACASWELRRAPDRNGAERKVIVFHLVQAGEPSPDVAPQSEPEESSLEALRAKAYAAARPQRPEDRKKAKTNYYTRSADVASYVLARSGGICESCNRPAPFARRDETAYLEPHHIRRLSDGGPDDPRWVGAICPNCHREIHHGQNGAHKNAALEQLIGKKEEDMG